MNEKLRPCRVDGENAFFHKWSDRSYIRDAVLQGTVSGVISDTFGIVEFEDGKVERVKPEEITFLDRVNVGDDDE